MTSIPRADEPSLIDEPSVVYALRVTLVIFFASALVISAVTLFLRWRLTPQLALVAGVSSLVALVLSRSGRIRPAMMLPLLFITCAVLTLAVRSDGIQNIGLAILPVLILVGSLILDRLTLVFFTASTILAVVGMLAIRYFVLLAERYSTNDMGDLFIFAITCATAALVGRLFALRIKDGFRRAQAYCQALGESERNVRLVADSLREMVVAYDMNRSLTYANSGAEKLIGYGPAELQGADPLSWTHPEDRPQVLALCDKAFNGQTVEEVVHRLITKDGAVKWAAGSWGPVTDETGHQVGIRATCLDITERIVAEKALEETTQKFRTIVEEITERKRAEETLRENEQRLVSIYNTVRDAIFHLAVEPEGQFRFVSVNLSFLRITGLNVEMVVGKTVNEVVPEPSLTMVLGKYRQAVEEKTIVFWEETSDYPTGRLTGEVSVAPVFDNNGNCTHLVGSVHDITERKQAETSLRDSEERFRVTFSQAAVGMAQTGLDGNWLLLNDRLCEILGYTQAELRGKNYLEITHPDDREPSRAAVLQLLAGDTSSWSTEKRHIRKDGAIVWVRLWVSLVRDQDNRPQYFIAVVEDVTDKTEAERALRDSERRLIDSEERLKSAERLAHVGNWLWDIKADRVFWSDELCRIFGRPPNYTPDYVRFLQAVQPEERERVDQAIRDRLAGKESPELEFQITRTNGEVRTVACISEVLRDGAGSPVRMYGACQDVTDQRRAEAASQKSRDEIAHLNRVAAMGVLTASLAHELNQPLAAILSNAQAANRFLDRESPDLAQVRECLTDIVADDKRAGEVIKTLRALLRKGESQASPVDLNEVVRDAIRLLGTDAMLRHASVKFEPLPALRLVRGDQTQLYQVVLNLIVNGLEATAERPPDNRWVLVRTAESEDDRVQLTVEDSGKGIPESDLARVFEPFFTTKREGLGMGLSISRTIVQAHGGRIWAENSARGGAIFRCLLPVAVWSRNPEQ